MLNQEEHDLTMRKFAIALACLALFACERSKRISHDDVQLDGSTVLTSTSSTDASQPTTVDHMVRVHGDFCPEVEQKCLRWLDKDQSPTANSGIGPMRCAEFAPSKCLSSKRRSMDFLIDKFEWPNRENEFPLVTIDWYSAKAKCEGVGKRLCTADEWTFACEGPTMKPYSYGDGLHRDESVCDQQHDSMDPSKPRNEWQKYNHSHPSGSFPLCKSEFGVFDLTVNADEWVHNVGGRTDGDPYFSGLKGGYWTYKVRSRCRPMTTVHGPGHSFYQQGFRCCKSVIDG